MLHLYKIHSQSRLFFCFQRIHLFINIGNTNHGSLEQLLVVELMLFPAPITCYLMLSPEVTLFSFPLSSLELYLQTNYSSISSFGILFGHPGSLDFSTFKLVSALFLKEPFISALKLTSLSSVSTPSRTDNLRPDNL